MTYLEGLKFAAERAVNLSAYGSAYTILDLGLAYGFPDGLPDHARDLWKVRCLLATCLSITDEPHEWAHGDAVWQEKSEQIQLLLNR